MLRPAKQPKGLVDAAAIEAAKCTTPGPCKSAGDSLFAALIALSISIAGLLVAVVAAFAASIAYFGIGVAIGIAAFALAVTIALAAISIGFLPGLDGCLSATTGAPASTAVKIQFGIGIAAGINLGGLGVGGIGAAAA